MKDKIAPSIACGPAEKRSVQAPAGNQPVSLAVPPPQSHAPTNQAAGTLIDFFPDIFS